MVLLPLAACFSSGGSGDSGDPMMRDIGEYNELQAALDEGRSEFLGEEAAELYAPGDLLYWLDYASWAPGLHSYDPVSGAYVDYAFSIGEGDTYNYRAADEAVATAQDAAGGIVYSVYDRSQADSLLNEVEFPTPTDGQRWWAYDVDGSDLYVMTTGSATTLWRCSPGQDCADVTTLESAGASVAEFWDFGVEDDTLYFIESGRLWRLDISANQATWLGNETEISGSVEWRDGGVLYISASGPFYYDYASQQVTDLERAIENDPYQLNQTFAASHHYLQDGTLYGDYLVYTGNDGVYAYQFRQGGVVPLLLEPRSEDLRIEYRYPQIMDRGSLFVTGLTSTSGSVGADGPVYRLEAAELLP